MTRGEMMAKMTAREYDEWMAFLTLYPIGERGAYIRAGQVVATIANVNRDAKKHPALFTPDDVFPWLAEETDDEAGEEAPDETLARMRTAFGLTVPAGGA